mgnify:CR=1 FL=1
MNVLDLIIGIILILFAIAGLRKGLIIEAFYLASFIVGIFGAMYFSDWVASWLAGFVDAFIITFVIFVVLTRFLGRIVSDLVSAIHLGFFDKIGGFLFGILKGGLILSVLILIMNVFGLTNLINANVKRTSILYPYVENVANILYKNHEVVRDSMKRSVVADNNIVKFEDCNLL